VEHLTHKVHSQSSEEHNDFDQIECRKLLRSFSSEDPSRRLAVEDGLVEELSRCLGLEDGEPPLYLLAELQDLTYSGSGDAGDTSTRQIAGHPVTLVCHNPSSSPSESSFKFEPTAIHR
jgi:hypothetical protein